MTDLDLLEYLYGILVNDVALTAAAGGTLRIYHTWAEPDAAFPYIVHTIEMQNVDEWGVWQGAWIVDTWDYGPNCARAIAMTEAVKVAADRKFYGEPAGKNFNGSRIWFVQDFDFSESEERVWRRSCRFGIRLVARGHALAVLEREGVS